MINHVSAALRRIQSDLAQVLDPEQITEACSDFGYRFRKRVLDPTTTIHLFVTQILNGNFAVARLEEFTDKQFSEAAYCNARGRLPLQVLQTLLKRVGSALQPIMNETGCWRKHRTFHIDGSAFSMPDTEELQKEFGQPGRQRAGCGFPVAHLLTLFHAGTGFLVKTLAAPLRTHDMKEASLLHPELEEGDVLIGDRGFCSFAHLALLRGRKLHGVFRVHQKQLVDFHPGRPHTGPGQRHQKGRPSSRWLKRLGKQDQVVEYCKPKRRPAWMTQEEYAALPKSVIVRELRYQVPCAHSRTREVTLVTTLLDAEAYPAKALAELYGQRWQIETNLRHLKQTMKMDVLRCETVNGVLKELTVFALVYNLVRAVMYEASQRQEVPVQRISFADALGWLRNSKPGSELRRLKVNPERPDRYEPRVVKRRQDKYSRMTRPREVLRKQLAEKRRAS
jgi:Transposase DDE domain